MFRDLGILFMLGTGIFFILGVCLINLFVTLQLKDAVTQMTDVLRGRDTNPPKGR